MIGKITGKIIMWVFILYHEVKIIPLKIKLRLSLKYKEMKRINQIK